MTPQALTLTHQGEQRQAWFAAVKESDLRAHAAQPESFLHESELAVFSALRFPQKRASFLLGRLAAKAALAALLDETEPRRIAIRAGVFGQPLVQHARAAGVEVTLSHSHDLAVALASSGESPLGIDLECVAAASAATVLGELQASAAEQAWLSGQGGDTARACGVLWTAREALGKSMKIGLNCPLGILALERLDNAGPSAWIGHYANFPHSRCLIRAIGGRVLAIALPLSTELTPWPALPPE